jgi:rhodanese-related sulfurtransferase
MFFRRRPTAATLSPQDAVNGARDGTVTVVDVREHSEVRQTGIARGALHIPMTRLAHLADPQHPDYNPALRRDGRIALYCASGARSGNAMNLMRRMGYEDVHNIGGLVHWQRAGGQIDSA